MRPDIKVNMMLRCARFALTELPNWCRTEQYNVDAAFSLKDIVIMSVWKHVKHCSSCCKDSKPPSLYIRLVIYALEYKHSSCENQGDQNQEGVWEVILE